MNDERCEEYRELASAAADEQLPGADLLRLERHRGECPACRDFEAAVLRTRELLQAAEAFRPLRRPQVGFAAAVMRQTAAVAPGTRTVVLPARRPAKVWVGLAMAAATAAVFFAWSWFRLLPLEKTAPLAARPAAILVAEEGSMESYLHRHASLARDATILGPAEEVDFTTFTAGAASGR